MTGTFDEERFRAAIRKYLAEFADVTKAVMEAAKKLESEAPVPEGCGRRADEILLEEIGAMDVADEIKATLLEGVMLALNKKRGEFVV